MNITGWGRLIESRHAVSTAVRVVDYLSAFFSGNLPDAKSHRYAIEFILQDKMYRTRWLRSTKAAVNEWQSIFDASRIMNIDELQTRFSLENLTNDPPEAIRHSNSDD
jgi:hypothetical protein